MKDPLTPNLPEGWKHWAESNETRLFGLGVLVALNLYLSFRIGLSACYNRKEKQFWLVLLWFFPFVAHVFYLQHSWQTRKAGMAATQPSVGPGREN